MEAICEKNLVWHNHEVTQEMRQRLNNHQPAVIWFTGLSGSGKSTLANQVESELHKLGCQTYLLDGDNVRSFLNKDLGFTAKERTENIRRVGEVARLFADSGQIVLTAFISPFQSDRDIVRSLLPEGQFIEVHVDTPLEECEKRDPKGLYRKARAGELDLFTGITSPYEPPKSPEVVVQTVGYSKEDSAKKVISLLYENGIVNG